MMKPLASLHPWIAAALLLAAASSQAAICRVSPTGTGDGGTWAQAAPLPAALADAACTEIRLAQGTYTSADSPNRFTITRNLRLLGGYAGTDADPERRGGADLTVLSGEHAGARARVLLIDGTLGTPITASTLIEGLTIANGRGEHFGGGVMCDGTASVCSPRFRRVNFSGNLATTSGGAICNVGDDDGTSSPEFVGVSFVDNEAAANGGAVFNSAERTGTSSPRFTNVTFSSNRSGYGGGAIFNNAGNGRSEPTFSHASFIANHDEHPLAGGGAFYGVSNGSGVSNILVRSSVFWGNTTGGDRGPVAWSEGPGTHITVTDSLVQGGCDTAMGGHDGGSSGCPSAILTDDPLLGSLADNGGGTLTHLPTATSPLLDAAACLSGITTDQRGVTRPQGAGATACDMGAVERRQGSHALSVDVTGPGTVSGGAGACASTTTSCVANYVDENDPLTVTLGATPGAGQSFTGWGGACTGTGPTCTVVMSQARHVTARFTALASPGAVQPVPTLGAGALALLGALIGLLALRRRV